MARPDRARAERHGRKIRQTLSVPAARALSSAGSPSIPADGAKEIGTPGNQNIFGWLTNEDYNRDLDGQVAAAVFDEMRKGHAQTQAALLTCKLPIKGAVYRIEPASDDPQDVAIADFVTAALLDDDAMETTWSEVMDAALLKLDFGSSASEIVWMVDEHGAVRFRKLAPRPPKTFYRWLEKDGRLETLEQYAFKNGSFGFWEIPRDKLILHVRQREGNNWFGVSLLRAAYPHWWYIKQLYRIAAVSADREHQGIPIAKLTEKYSTTSAPLDKIEQTLQGLRSYDRAFLVQPFGVEYDWLTSKSTGERMAGLMQLIEHHNMMIARSVLQSFSAQGEQAHGSFGAASITFEAYQDAERGTVSDLCTEFRSQAIKPLCELNFNMAGRKTPKLVLDNLGKLDAGLLSKSVADLATAGILTMDDDLEDWARSLVGAPAMPESMRGRDRSKPTAVVVPGAPGATPPAGPGPRAIAPRSATPESDDVEGIAAAKGGFSELGITFSREPSALERRVLALHEIPRRLDDEKAKLARELAALRLEQVTALAAVLAKKDARKTAAFTDLRASQLPKPKAAEVKKAIRASQDRVLLYGAEQVQQELGRQGRKTLTRPRLADLLELSGSSPATNKTTAKSALVSSATTTADRLASSWQTLALENAQRLRRSGLVGDALVAAILEALDATADGGTTRAANEEVNEAFSLGRATEAQTASDEIESAQYSAVMDANTCDNCAELDGQEFDLDSEAYVYNTPPYVGCEGRDQCRCVYIYMLKSDEAIAAARGR